MKTLGISLLLAVSAVLIGCQSGPPPYSPGAANLERIERSSPVTDAPEVRHQSLGDPANNYPYRGGYYGRPYYGRPYYGY